MSRPQLIRDHVNAIISFHDFGITDIRSFIDVDAYQLREIFDELEATVDMFRLREVGAFQKVAIFVSFQSHGITMEGSTMAHLNTS